jgi:hypothetical protein
MRFDWMRSLKSKWTLMTVSLPKLCAPPQTA